MPESMKGRTMCRLVIVMLAAIGLATEGHGQDVAKPTSLSWEALDAERELFFDPFAKLSSEQLQDLSYVMRVRWLVRESKLSADSNDVVKAENVARRLKKEGIDIAWLMLQRERVRDLRDRQLQTHAASVAKGFHGQQVVLNGFAVPIRSTAEGVSEFFLVPSIDFCNASAPPSTQVIYVKSMKGPAVSIRTTPLQVTGTLKQRTTGHSFIFPGKTLHFEAEYSLEPSEVKIVNWQSSHTTRDK